MRFVRLYLLDSWLVGRVPIVWLTKLHWAIAVGVWLLIVAWVTGLAIPFLGDDAPQECKVVLEEGCDALEEFSYWSCRRDCFDENLFIVSLVVVQTLCGLAVVAWLAWQFYIRDLVPQSRPASWSKIGIHTFGAIALAAGPFGLMGSLHTRRGAGEFLALLRIDMFGYGLICTVLVVFLLKLAVVLTHGRPVIGAVSYISTNVIGLSLILLALSAQSEDWQWVYYVVGVVLAAVLGIAGMLAVLPARGRFLARSAVGLSIALAMIPFAPLVGSEYFLRHHQYMFSIDGHTFAKLYGYGIGVLVICAPVLARQLKLMRALPK